MRYSAVTLSLLLLTMITHLAAAEGIRPNIVLILADDLGYSDLGCYGGEIPTLNIDQLAEHGVRFSQVYNNARCCPTRASLLTGLGPHQAGVGSMADLRPDSSRGEGYLGHLNQQCTTFAEIAKAAGYQTKMVGKWHVGKPGPTEFGFDDFYGYVTGHSHDQWEEKHYERLPADKAREHDYSNKTYYATQAFNDYAVTFLEQTQSNPDQPFLLYLAHSSPHFPVQAPQERIEKFVAVYRQGWDVLRAQRFEKMKKLGLVNDTWQLTPRSLVPVDQDDIANGFSGQQNPAWESIPPARREDLAYRMAIFAAMVSYVDEGVGRIVECLKKMNKLDNTVIMFLSDNGACYEWGPYGFDGVSRRGETILHTGDNLKKMGGPHTHHSYGSAWANLGNTPFRSYKHFTYEGGISTPFIVHWPKGLTKENVWVHQPCHVYDVVPTIMELTKGSYPQERQGQTLLPLQGRSLVPLMNGGNMADREIFFEHEGARAVRHGNWKAVLTKRVADTPEWELFDLETDRCEMVNLANRYPDRLKTMIEHWNVWAEKNNVFPPKVATQRPQIANKPITVNCDVQLNNPKAQGVILAQGGNKLGYALHIKNQELVFTIKLDGKGYPISVKEYPADKFHLTAKLLKNGNTILLINQQQVATGNVPGLIPNEPVDDLTIGQDLQSAVGDYDAPFPLEGKVSNVKVITAP